MSAIVGSSPFARSREIPGTVKHSKHGLNKRKQRTRLVLYQFGTNIPQTQMKQQPSREMQNAQHSWEPSTCPQHSVISDFSSFLGFRGPDLISDALASQICKPLNGGQRYRIRDNGMWRVTYCLFTNHMDHILTRFFVDPFAVLQSSWTMNQNVALKKLTYKHASVISWLDFFHVHHPLRKQRFTRQKVCCIVCCFVLLTRGWGRDNLDHILTLTSKGTLLIDRVGRLEKITWTINFDVSWFFFGFF